MEIATQMYRDIIYKDAYCTTCWKIQNLRTSQMFNNMGLVKWITEYYRTMKRRKKNMVMWKV